MPGLLFFRILALSILIYLTFLLRLFMFLFLAWKLTPLSLLLLSLGSTLFLLDDPSGRIYVGGAEDLIGLSLATLIPFFLRKTNIMELISLAMKFLILESVVLIWVLLI
jgi:hypothetical protein